MNKWIPISLFVFLGIYLLTTAQAYVGDIPVPHTTITMADKPVNPINFAHQ